MTKHECAVIMAFTGVAMLKPDDLGYFYDYIQNIIGRPIYTHELAAYADQIKENARNDFVMLCATATDEAKNDVGSWYEKEMTCQCLVCNAIYYKPALQGMKLHGEKFPRFCPNCGAQKNIAGDQDGGAEHD